MGDEGGTSKAARIGLEILGWLLLAAGVAALVLPGPGLLLVALGCGCTRSITDGPTGRTGNRKRDVGGSTSASPLL